jgi:hypothetical protein
VVITSPCILPNSNFWLFWIFKWFTVPFVQESLYPMLQDVIIAPVIIAAGGCADRFLLADDFLFRFCQLSLATWHFSFDFAN